MATYRPPEDPRDGHLTLLLGPVVAWLVLWSALLGWHVDDAGISYAYARNLAEGLGLVPFQGSPPVEGFSNPAWTLLLAASAWIGIPPPIASKLLQGLLGAGVLLGVHSLVHKSTGSRAEAAASALLAGICTPYVLWSASGLETALLAAALVGFLEGVARDRPGWWVGLLAGIAATARPEGAVLALASFLAAEALVPPERWHARRATAGATALLLFTCWLAVRLSVFGAPLPNTWWAKVRGSVSTRVVGGAVYLGAAASQLGLPMLAVGWITGWRNPRLRRLTRATTVLVVAAGACVLWVGGDWLRHGRLIAHAVPLLAMACAPGLLTLFLRPRDVGREPVGPRGQALMWLYAAGFFAIQIYFSADALRQPPLSLATVRDTTEMLVRLGRSSCETARPTVATPDVGALLYDHPEVTTLDLGGLVDWEAARAHGDRYWPSRLRAQRPHAVFVHGVFVPRTGLTKEVLQQNGYRALCSRRGTPGPAEATHPPTLYVDSACLGALPPRLDAALRDWCARSR